MKYIAFNVIYLLFFAAVVGGGIYLGIWHSVVKEFSAVKVDMNLQEIKRIQEYQLARTRQESDNIPLVKEWASVLSEHDKETFNAILVRANKFLLTFVAVLVLVVIATTIILSHRVAGPIFRLKRDLKTVIDGDLTVHFSLRERDELKDLAKSIDTAVHGLADNIDDVKRCLENYEKASSEEEKKKYVHEAEQIVGKYRIIHGK